MTFCLCYCCLTVCVLLTKCRRSLSFSICHNAILSVLKSCMASNLRLDISFSGVLSHVYSIEWGISLTSFILTGLLAGYCLSNFIFQSTTSSGYMAILSLSCSENKYPNKSNISIYNVNLLSICDMLALSLMCIAIPAVSPCRGLLTA